MRRRPLASALAACALAGCVLALAACDFEQVVELDLPPYEPRLALGGFPTPDSVFAARVGRSASAFEPLAFDGTDLLVPEARLALFAEDGAFLDSLRYEAGGGRGGYYRSVRELRPEPGRAYTLRAEAPGLPRAEATTRLPASVPFTVRFERFVEDARFGGRAARLVVAVPEPPEAQAYSLLIRRSAPPPDGLPRAFPVPFRSADPALRSGFAEIDVAVDLGAEFDDERVFERALFRDGLFGGGTREITLDALLFDGEEEPATLTVSLDVLSEDYVRYQQTLALQDLNAGNPFAEPVRIHSNVAGGLGVFAGYAGSAFTVDLAARPVP